MDYLVSKLIGIVKGFKQTALKASLLVSPTSFYGLYSVCIQTNFVPSWVSSMLL